MNRLTNASKSVDLFGAGKHGYSDSIPTRLDSAAQNPIQEELARIVENLGGGTLSSTRYNQCASAINLARTRDAFGEPIIETLSTTTYQMNTVCGGGTNAAPYLMAAGASGKLMTKALNAELTGTSSWSAAISAGSSYTGSFTAAVWVPSIAKWIVVGTAGEIQSLTTGGTATRLKVVTGTPAVTGIGYDGGSLLVAVTGSGDGKVWTADTSALTTWTDRGYIDGGSSSAFKNVASGGGRVASIGSNLSVWSTATGGTGATWISAAITATGVPGSLAYNAELGLWLAVGAATSGYTDAAAWSSPDLIAWTYCGAFFTGSASVYFSSVSACPGGFVCGLTEASGCSIVCTSDGTAWKYLSRTRTPLLSTGIPHDVQHCYAGQTSLTLLAINETPAPASSVAGVIYRGRRISP